MEKTTYAVDPSNPKETIELIKALVKVFDAQKLIREDGKIDYKDAAVVIAMAPAIYTGFLGVKYIDDELRVINDDGHLAIKRAIAELVIGDDQDLERLVEMYMELVLQMVRTAVYTLDYMKPAA